MNYPTNADFTVNHCETTGSGIYALDILELISAKCPQTQVLLFTPPGSLKFANLGLRAGAYHYSTLPISNEELKLLMESAIQAKPQLGPNMLFKADAEKTTFESMIGKSSVMQRTYRQIRQAAATDIPVLISGETGTGKELAAQAIHELSTRTSAACIPVHIASLPQDLVASELFGHVAGAFTGASRSRKGCFELAEGGTVFLDEIGTIDQKMQVSLLRLLETSEFCKIGSQESQKVDVRVIAATNADLADEIKLGNFREDLYYRLDVLNIEMPPLRERNGDIPLLVIPTRMTIRVGMTMAQVEKELIIRTLGHTGGNRSRASEILGISRRALYNKMERHGLQKKSSTV